jgi:NhaA family Na+:H+ antiporter
MQSSHESKRDREIDADLPTLPVDRLLGPLQRFLHIEALSGVVLLVCTVIALVVANSGWAEAFAHFWETPVDIHVGSFHLSDSLVHLVINDGLMTVFFFVVGLEIKREIVAGELSDLRKAVLPVVAAIGGMVVPAIIYYVMQWGQIGQRGWAIPMATDIAFVVGFLAIFGNRIPLGLKIFLLSLAIVDDLGAVLIIAFVFTEKLVVGWIAVAGVTIALVYVLNRLGVRMVGVYLVLGMVIWLGFLESGIHPTVAGVILGMMTPARPLIENGVLSRVIDRVWYGETVHESAPKQQAKTIRKVGYAARESVSPLHRLENLLHPWVAYVIMPLFALSNAGVVFEGAAIQNSVASSVAVGLMVGKPVGILLISFAAVRLRITSLPLGVSWSMLAGGACLAGIGFTMALFLNTLTFPVDQYASQEAAGKIGTLAGSTVSAVIGIGFILFATRRPATTA